MKASTGKRSVIEREVLETILPWCRTFGVTPPGVKVRNRAGAIYRLSKLTIFWPCRSPKDSDAALSLLVHEFAHHMASVHTGKRQGHGRGFE